MIGTRKWVGFRSVLCPIDFSEHSRHALEYAAADALDAKAGLHVLYVGAQELQAFIDATLPPRTRRRVGLTALVSAGDPADQILKAAARQRSDLIVVGSHGANAAKRLLVGSTTLDLLQRATVPVLAIPRRARGPLRAQPR